MTTRKRASVHTLGCRLNQSETALIADRLQAEGYELVPFGDETDVAIINTCTVTREADAKSRKLLRQTLRSNPNAYTAVVGCYAQMGAEALAEIEGLDLIVGNQEKLNVLDYIRTEKNRRPVVIRDKILRSDFRLPTPPSRAAQMQRMNLKVQDGCDFMCSFCIIPFARGRARSRSWRNMLEEAELLVEAGARELVLTGVNIGAYDSDGKTLVHLVDALHALPGLARIRISSIEPTTAPEALFERMADPSHRLTPYLHLPLQSGSNRILRAMRRKYTCEEYLEFAALAHARVPGIGMGTDLMVGFPGESEEDFLETLRALCDSPLAYAHVFKYSPRKGAASVRLPEQVPPQIANERSAQLRRASAHKGRLFAEAHVGQRMDVLFEEQQAGRWHGHTGNYLRVSAASQSNLANRIMTVRVQGVHEDRLWGEVET